ncbi:MAG TPA: cysteine peptidase family C39 domain-containing protein [Verrucomicrobiae bacterium]|nr:cysteine peptidase family C39 domain-containing protein [Verrucomicrobiae bacterium]
MNLWLEIIFSALFGIVGFALGHLPSRLPKGWWLLGYFVPLTVILIYGVGIHYPSLLSSASAVSWLIVGRKKFTILGFVAAMVLATPLSRLPRKRDRTVIVSFIVATIFVSSIWPFLTPMFNRSQLAQLHTRIDADGVCLQNTGYTCGPAAAVTALRRLGLPAEEGEIAILSQTSSFTGTPPDLLAEALQQRYGRDGLIVDYRFFKNLDELQKAGLTLAVVKFSFMVDHYVTVLKVSDSAVTVGDPLSGIQIISRGEFLNQWRSCGIVLKKKI